MSWMKCGEVARVTSELLQPEGDEPLLRQKQYLFLSPRAGVLTWASSAGRTACPPEVSSDANTARRAIRKPRWEPKLRPVPQMKSAPRRRGRVDEECKMPRQNAECSTTPDWKKASRSSTQATARGRRRSEQHRQSHPIRHCVPEEVGEEDEEVERDQHGPDEPTGLERLM